jgi:hypothetical protein
LDKAQRLKYKPKGVDSEFANVALGDNVSYADWLLMWHICMLRELL